MVKLCGTAFTSGAEMLLWRAAHWVLEQSFHRDTLLPTNVNYSNSVPWLNKHGHFPTQPNLLLFIHVCSLWFSACRHSSGLLETGATICRVSFAAPTAEQPGAAEQEAAGGIPKATAGSAAGIPLLTIAAPCYRAVSRLTDALADFTSDLR